MLDSLRNFVSASDPSSLKDQLIEEALSLAKASVKNEPPASLSILFIGEHYASKKFKEIKAALYQINETPNFPGKLDCQLLRAFLGQQFPRMRKERLEYSGYQDFSEWFVINKEMLDPRPPVAPLATNKKSKEKLKPTDLEKACKSSKLCEALYEELCSLALYRKYKADNNTFNILDNASRFNINLYSPVKKQIEDILTHYRRWMISNKKINLALSDLIILRESPYKNKLENKKYTHVLWGSNQKISPNIKRFLDDISNEIIDLSALQEQTPISKPTATISDAEFSSIENNPLPHTEPKSAITSDDIESSFKATPMHIRLSTQHGKDTLKKILVKNPLLAEEIFKELADSVKVLTDFIIFIFQTNSSNPISLHYFIMQKTIKIFEGIIDLYLKIHSSGTGNPYPIRVAIANIALEEHDEGLSALKWLCLPENHQTFLKLLDLKIGIKISDYWNKIKKACKKIVPGKEHESLLWYLLQTIYGIAIINHFVCADVSNKIEPFLTKKSALFLAEHFSERIVYSSDTSNLLPIAPFIDLLRISTLIDFEKIAPQFISPAELEIITLIIFFLSENSILNNPWPVYTQRIFSSILIALAKHLQRLSLSYWQKTILNIPWGRFVELLILCRENLSEDETQIALTTLFKITHCNSLQSLSNENALCALHKKIQETSSGAKDFFDTTIDYLLDKNAQDIQELLKKTIHPERYLTLISLINHVDLKNAKEKNLFAKILSYLKDHTQEISFPKIITINANIYEEIFNALSHKQHL